MALHEPVGCTVEAAVDAYDAMTASRPYSNASTAEEAIAELRRYAGSQFDPAVTEAFIAIVCQIVGNDAPADTPTDPAEMAA